ncbi:CHAT domain-containing protein [Lactarius indigo]|nr:CHAT domain-containing protein [Lactarius indigo]
MAGVPESMSIHEIDSEIVHHQQILAISPLPDDIRLLSLLSLAVKQFERHMRSNQKEDIDKSIFHFTKSILLPPFSWLQCGPLIFQALLTFAGALFKRSMVSKQPEDAIFAAKYLRYLRDHPHATLGFSRHEITTLLALTLAFQVELEPSNAVQIIEEMTVLFRELLTEDASEDDITASSTFLSHAVSRDRYLWALDQPLPQVIDCLRLAKICRPELRVVHCYLAFCLCARYGKTLVNDDYEEAAAILDECIASSSPGDIPDEYLDFLQRDVAAKAALRWMAHSTPESSEEAMYRARAIIRSDPDGHDCRLNDISEIIAKYRFGYFGSVEDEAPSWIFRPVSMAPFEDSYTAELARMLDNLKLLEELFSGIRNNDITNIDEAVGMGRTKLTSSIPRDPLVPTLFEVFADMLFEAFRRTRKIEYLNESISTRRQIFGRPGRPSYHTVRIPAIWNLSNTLLTRFEESGHRRTQDLDEALELLSHCSNDRYGKLSDRFHTACFWASISRFNRHRSVSTAYKTAVSLMQDTLLFAPTLQLQHTTLAKMKTDHHRIPLDYASYQVELHQLEEAVETLERGRALLWSEMRHLRTSIDRLQQTDPQLAHKFAVINRDLEELTKSIPPSHELSIDDGETDDLRAVDAIRSSVAEAAFLTSPSFDTLRSAASGGPIVIINHSKWRSDILILLQTAPPSLIPTAGDFYDCARILKDKLLESRHKYGLDSSHYDQVLAFVLGELYELVGKHVIDRLRQLNVPEQSRIWLCPTSVFCSLPLHAMGPIPSDDREMRYFLDLYICSYTPTLSALIQSRNRNFSSRSSDRPSLLLVAQPDPTIPTVGGEIKVVQSLDTKVTSLLSEAATPATVVDGFRHHQFVHFACHGTLEPNKPFEAGFEFHGGERLTILDIVRSDLPTAEFAFLSACHTAEVTEGSIVDEGLHLAAAVQYCGFRSVVGTMWAMADVDGEELAKHFYKALFTTSEGDQGVPYHERSAQALQFAGE